jgi:hypothetical protein
MAAHWYVWVYDVLKETVVYFHVVYSMYVCIYGCMPEDIDRYTYIHTEMYVHTHTKPNKLTKKSLPSSENDSTSPDSPALIKSSTAFAGSCARLASDGMRACTYTRCIIVHQSSFSLRTPPHIFCPHLFVVCAGYVCIRVSLQVTEHRYVCILMLHGCLQTCPSSPHHFKPRAPEYACMLYRCITQDLWMCAGAQMCVGSAIDTFLFGCGGAQSMRDSIYHLHSYMCRGTNAPSHIPRP